MGLAQMMYMQDWYENIMFWRNVPPTATPNEKALGSWVNQIQPYVKSGPVKDLAVALADPKPCGMFACPSFSIDKFAKGTDQAECDGDGNSTPGSGSSGYRANSAILAHYGMPFHYYGGDGLSIGTAKFDWPGSGWETDSNGNPYAAVISLASVRRPAETANIGDGIAYVTKSKSGVGAQFSCESMYAHQDSGSNFVFLDGHAKYSRATSSVTENRIQQAYGMNNI